LQKVNFHLIAMDKYTSDKASVSKSRSRDDVVEDSIEEKALRPSLFSASWFRSILLTVETTGIQRVTEEERKQNTSKVWNACTFWYGAPDL
jgi:hypothetical protein